MFWEKTASKGTMKNCEKPIVLKDSYYINWKCYSKLDDENTGTFMYVVNKIKNNQFDKCYIKDFCIEIIKYVDFI